ncbi:MAG: hypothetical protein DRG82_02220 [Deltaproteobacteria bacterium]|nr:MAG: hypothetical protein DRG82_02220 [Deltaproteobacteria bacterium]
MNEKHPLPPNLKLLFRKGDLIVKEGDYGISIYRILKGKVAITIQSGDKEVRLATLSPGEIIGEVTFLNRNIEPRTASARALEDTQVEVWHPSRLTREYDQMEPIIRYISDQVLGRLIRMNKFISQLGTKGFKKQVEPETAASQRSYYRKEIDTLCEYRPLDIKKAAWLKGKLTNISLSGLGLDVSSRNNLQFPHEPGKVFRVRATLPNGKEVQVDAKIVTVTKSTLPGRIRLGMAIGNITEEAKKTLGFFLMP